MNKSQTERRHCSTNYYSCLFITVLALLIGACDRQEREETARDEQVAEERQTESAEVSEQRTESSGASKKFSNYQETGDLADIEKRGIIRFVQLYEDPNGALARSAIVSQSNTQLAKRLAAKLGLTPYFLVAETPQQGIEMIINGEADVFAESLEATEERSKLLGLTEPLQRTQRVLVTGKKGPDISSVKQLKNVELTVLKDSTLSEAAKQIAAENASSNITVRELPMDELTGELLESIDGSDPIITIMAERTAETLEGFQGEAKIGDKVSDEPVAIVWAVRKDANNLRTRINNFLIDTLVKAPPQREADWKSIKESGVLRFATYNGPGYFIWKGVLTGLDYELASKFAEENDLELQIIAVPDKKDLTDLLKTGQADIAGASTTITESRRKQGVDFTTPILETTQTVLSNKKSPPINTLQDLNGRTLTLRSGSAFIETANTLRQSGVDVKVEVAPEDASFGDIIKGVASGEFDATLEDTNLAAIQAALYPELVAGAVVSDPLPQAWMVERDNNTLLEKVDQFLEEFLGVKKNRAMVDNYYKPNKQLLKRAEAPVMPGGELSPYDKLAKKFALKHNLDWRLVVAQMWQESNFDPKAESHMGAQGLMQVMPRTAQEMGFDGPLFDPEHSVHAGTKYLDWVRERFEDELPADEKLWFALAAYNAGIGHLRDARLLAKKLNLDPNQWFDNVEVAMLKLSEPRYFEKARYGYARGAEPVQYVKNISNLYRAYTDMASGDIARLRHPLPGYFSEASPGRSLITGVTGQFCPQQSGATLFPPRHSVLPSSLLPTAASPWSQ
ncbi:membrane-bound lytic murein transglycosylase F [Microbulbifer donghaiensis]|uniref:Membrane-bound lytic murein transglycosylase F n=1 Tax=Microbulbifer donghaiensis TaxID=494016 RepID=A0A1M4X061_9GAMM|nr:transporter substrate-binding domain-containing protein [Microbulbifer donghaiensis]SHE86879.1 membrane-bound lytic murein transglycosylase F [Microbulbifer donghaiensis]